jgi:hypothetical protein
MFHNHHSDQHTRFSVDFAAAKNVLVVSKSGLPVSTTHAAVECWGWAWPAGWKRLISA